MPPALVGRVMTLASEVIALVLLREADVLGTGRVEHALPTPALVGGTLGVAGEITTMLLLRETVLIGCSRVEGTLPKQHSLVTHSEPSEHE